MAKLIFNVFLQVFIAALIAAGSLVMGGQVLAHEDAVGETHEEELETQAASREKISTGSKEWWILLAGSLTFIVVLSAGVRKFIQVPHE